MKLHPNIGNSVIDLKQILDNVNASIFITNREHNIIYCNKSQLDTMNSPAYEVIGKNLTDILHPQDIEQVLDNNNQVMRQNRHMTFTENLTIDNGTQTYVTNKSPYYQNDKLFGVIGISIAPAVPSDSKPISQNHDPLNIIQKISSLKPDAYDHQIATNHDPNLLMAYINTILDIMPASFFCYDKEDRLVACNNYQAKICGFKHRNDIINLKIEDIPGLDQNSIIQLTKNNHKVMSTSKTQVLTETGYGKTYRSYKKRITDTKNNPAGLVGIALDITDLTNAQRELKEERDKLHSISQAKTRFIMNISHDLRTPCAGIESLTDLLIAKNQDPDQLEYLHDIQSSIRQLTKILNQSIEFARHENGVVPINFTRFNISKLINNLITLYTPEAKHKGIAIEHNAQAQTNMFCSDSPRIQQIMINIIGNAVKFTNQGMIVINSKITKAGQLIITITDTGCGIETTYHEKIFDAFTRIQDSFANAERGSGLGLSLVKRLLTEINGDIKLDSKPNEGSTFTISIKQQSPSAQRKQLINTNSSIALLENELNLIEKGKYYKVLIIEDEPIAQKVNHALLKRYQCVVDIAADGQVALSKPLDIYDLIISDIGLPDIDGLDLARKIKARLKYMSKPVPPMIGLTAHLHAEDELHRRQEKNPFDFITSKPLTAEFLESL